MPGKHQGDSNDWFPATRWSVVRAALQESSLEARDALTQLCEVYWFPLYAYVRHRGYSAHDAQDLIQGFFASFLSRDPGGRLDPEQGKFRAFLLACLKHFLSNERDRARALKRGGQHALISWDALDAEERFRHQSADHLSPDRLYEKQWALALLDHVLSRLEAEMVSRGNARRFECLKGCLALDREALSYAEAARQLGMTEGAVKTAVHRFRRRFREILQEEISHTVTAPGQVEGELQALFASLTS